MTIYKQKAAAFLADDTGAVTVDWVVLTAGIVGLGLASMTVVSAGTENLSGDVGTQMTEQEIVTSFASGLSPYDGDWLAPGAYDSDSAWVATLSDASILGLLDGYEAYSDPANVDQATHNEPRYHDQYWMAYNQAIDRGLI